MTYKTFKIDEQTGKTNLTVVGDRSIRKELSSLSRCNKTIVKSILNNIYTQKPMWYGPLKIEVNATCDPRDTFSEEKGIEICKIKADLKYHEMMYNRYLSVYWTISMLKMQIEKFMHKHQEKIERLEKDLNQYQK